MGSGRPINDTDDGRADPLEALRSRYLRAAMAVHLGEYMAMIVTAYLIFRLSHSVAASGLVLVCFNVPSLLLAKVATTLTHRWGAPLVDSWINAAEGFIALVPAGLAATKHLSVVTLLSWVLAYGVCEGLNAPNSLLVRQLIAAPGRVPELNSAYTRNVAFAAAAGMLLGGVLYVEAGPAWVFLACAVTSLPEVLVFRQISRHRSSRGVAHAPDESLHDALHLLRSEPGLWAACRFAVLCFFVAGYSVTLPAIANSIGSNAEILSLLESGSLVGGILVALVVRRIHGRVRWGEIQRLCYFGAGAGLLAMAGSEYVGGVHSRVSGIVSLLATIPVGFAVLMNTSIVTSVIQIGTPENKRASMFTLLALIPLVVGPTSQEIVGLVADNFSVSAALGAVAVTTISANLVISHRPMSRHFDRLNEADSPFLVNEMASQRGGRRGHLHARHWIDAA